MIRYRLTVMILNSIIEGKNKIVSLNREDGGYKFLKFDADWSDVDNKENFEIGTNERLLMEFWE